MPLVVSTPRMMLTADGQSCVPLVLLQCIKSLLSLSDMRLARLVCREWASELAAAVNNIRLPPELWQMPNAEQARQLKSLTTTYWSFKQVTLLACSDEEVCSESVHRAVDALQSIPALHCVTVSGLGSSSMGWAAVLQGLAGLPDTVTSLKLSNIRLPGPAGLDGLSGLHNISSLTLQSSRSNKLQREHVAAIASMQQLKHLQLSFRAVAGCLAEPLTLDCLGLLINLQHLDIKYLGMSELSTGVCFANTDKILPGCQALTSLVLSRVPTPSLRGLFKLQQLRQLTLLQLSPMLEHQARSLALSTQLQQLTLDNIPLELLPRLASLARLTSLQLSLWTPPAAAGGQDLPGGANILSLVALTGLQALSLSGPVMLTRNDVQVLAAAWQGLTALSLSVTLLDGTQGFVGFKALTSLRLEPWCVLSDARVGAAVLASEEAGVQQGGGNGLLVCEHDLPAGLQELEGRELTFLPSTPDAQMHEQELIVPPLQLHGLSTRPSSTSCKKGLKTLRLWYSPDGASGRAPQLPGWQLLQGVTQLELQHPVLTGQQLAAALAACGGSLRQLSINAAGVTSEFSRALNAMAASPGSSSSLGSLGRSSHRRRRSSSIGAGKYTGTHCANSAMSIFSGAAAPMAAAAGVPASGVAVAAVAATAGIATAGATAGALSRRNSTSFRVAPSGSRSNSSASMFEGLRNSSVGLSLQSMGSYTLNSIGSFGLQSMGSASLANLFSDALAGLSRPGASSSSGPSSMGLGLGEGLGLAVLAQCTALEELSITVGDRVLGRAWGGIVSLPRLTKLSVVIASDAPGSVEQDMVPWLSSMKGLTWLGLGLSGPGAGNALALMVERLHGALPACQIYMLHGCRR